MQVRYAERAARECVAGSAGGGTGNSSARRQGGLKRDHAAAPNRGTETTATLAVLENRRPRRKRGVPLQLQPASTLWTGGIGLSERETGRPSRPRRRYTRRR